VHSLKFVKIDFVPAYVADLTKLVKLKET